VNSGTGATPSERTESAAALTRTAERPRQRVGVVPGCEGTAVWVRRIGTIPSTREYRVRWHGRAPACLVLVQPPTRSPMQANGLGGNRGGAWTALGEASKSVRDLPPYRGRGPCPGLGTALGEASKPAHAIAGRKRAAESGGRLGRATVLPAPGSVRRGPGTALARPTGGIGNAPVHGDTCAARKRLCP
jgi:hypothetical protein